MGEARRRKLLGTYPTPTKRKRKRYVSCRDYLTGIGMTFQMRGQIYIPGLKVR